MFCISFAQIIGSANRAKKHTAYITRAALCRMLSPTPQAEHVQPAARFAALAADLVRRRRRVRTVPDWTEFERAHRRSMRTLGAISRNPYDVNSDASGNSDSDTD